MDGLGCVVAGPWLVFEKNVYVTVKMVDVTVIRVFIKCKRNRFCTFVGKKKVGDES